MSIDCLPGDFIRSAIKFRIINEFWHLRSWKTPALTRVADCQTNRRVACLLSDNPIHVHELEKSHAKYFSSFCVWVHNMNDTRYGCIVRTVWCNTTMRPDQVRSWFWLILLEEEYSCTSLPVKWDQKCTSWNGTRSALLEMGQEVHFWNGTRSARPRKCTSEVHFLGVHFQSALLKWDAKCTS